MHRLQSCHYRFCKVVASDYEKYEGWGNYVYQVGERSWDGSKTLPKVRLTSEYWRP